MPDDYSPISSTSKVDSSASSILYDKQSSTFNGQGHQGNAALSAFEMRYRLEIASKYSVVEHLGFTTGQDEQPISLGEIYVPQRLYPLAKLGSATNQALPGVGIAEALERYGHVVVLGEPGSGKSTLVQYLAYSFARPDPTPISRRLGMRLPIPIVLRKHDVNQWNSSDDMLASFIEIELSASLRREVSVQTLSDTITDGTAILLIDGFDEVGEEETRLRLHKHLSNWLAMWPHVLVVITSRPTLFKVFDYPILSSYGHSQSPWLKKSVPLYKPGDSSRMLGFATASTARPQCMEIANFDKKDISQFVGKWYTVRVTNHVERDNAIQSLQQAINSSDRISKMAQIPSLLVLMALIHRNLAYLPSGRVELYDRITDAYLESLQRARGMRPFGAKMDQMKRWLADLAYAMLQEGVLVARREHILSWLESAMATDTLDCAKQAIEFLDFVEQRAGIIIAAGPGLYSWAHLSLQEYFAARHLRGMIRRFDDLAGLCFELTANDLWHETLILLFGMLSEFSGAADDLAQGMMDRADGSERENDYLCAFFILLLSNEPEQADAPHSSHRATIFTGHSINSEKTRNIVEWLLSSICHQLGPRAASRIHLLKRLDSENVQLWFSRNLDQKALYELGNNVFAVGRSLLDAATWNNIANKLVSERGHENWPHRQVRDLLFSTHGELNIVVWSASHLSLFEWLTEDFFNVCPADIELPLLLELQDKSPEFGLLAEMAAAITLNRSMLTRHLAWLATENSPEAHESLHLIRGRAWANGKTTEQEGAIRTVDVWHIKDPVLAPDAPMTWFSNSVAPTDELLVRELNPRLLQHAVISTRRSCAVSIVKSRAYSSLPDRRRWLWASLFAHDLWGRPDFGKESLVKYVMEAVYEFTTIRTEKMHSKKGLEASTMDLVGKLTSHCETANDDWTKLMMYSSQLLLGQGTPQIVQSRNILLDKGMSSPDSFTFPTTLSSNLYQTETVRQWPQWIKNLFFHDLEKPWLSPEWFSAHHPASKYFCSSKESLANTLLSEG